MSYITPVHQGLSYGDGTLQGAGALGQVVRLVGNDRVAVNTDPTLKSFGLLAKDYTDGDMPGVYCNGGVYETVHRKKDGTVFPIEASTKIVTIQGKPYGMRFFLRKLQFLCVLPSTLLEN